MPTPIPALAPVLREELLLSLLEVEEVAAEVAAELLSLAEVLVPIDDVEVVVGMKSTMVMVC